MSRSRTGTGSLLWRHLRARPAAGMTVAVLVLLLSALATAGPRAIAALNDAALGYELGRLSAPERDLVDEVPQWPNPGPSESMDTGYAPDVDAAFGSFAETLERVRNEADEPLRSALGTAQYIVRSGSFPLAEAPRTRAIDFAADPLLESRVRFTDGAAPAPIPPASPDFSTDVVEAGRIEIAPMEIALSEATAERMGWTVGEYRTIDYPWFPPVPRPVILSGVFTALDPDDAFWDHATSIIDPFVFDDGNQPEVITGTALVDPGTFHQLGVQSPEPARRFGTH